MTKAAPVPGLRAGRMLRELARDLVWTFAFLAFFGLVLAVFLRIAYRPASPQDIHRSVAELAAFIERERGMPFVRLPEVVLLDDAAFALSAARATLASAELRLRERNNALLHALRLKPAGLDDEVLARAVAASGSLGHYTPAEHRIHIRGRALTPRVRITLAHELEHAFWGARLRQWEQEDGAAPASREATNASQPLREGTAVLLEQRYRESLPWWQQRWEAWERAWYGWRGQRDSDAAIVPSYYQQALALSYPLGEALASTILEDGGAAALQRAQRHGLASSEQLLNPQRYLVGEMPLAVPTPAADGAIEDEDRLGAFDLGSLLAIDGVPPEVVQRAVSGWGGDHYVLWRDRGRACVRVALVGDSPEDTADIADALRLWAARRSDVQVATSGGLPTFTSCQAEGADR